MSGARRLLFDRMSSSPETPDTAGNAAAQAPPDDATLPTRDRTSRGLPPIGAVVAGEMLAGKYRLLELLGRGGMAQVWRAEHVPLRRDVAVKLVLAEWLTDPQVAAVVLARFQFEAQVSAQLCEKSKHVVAVYDYGTHRGLPYLVMELITGRSLEREIEMRGKVPPGEVADILDQAADALDTAHALGIVHRDLKPSNLLLAEGKGGARVAKVADFGVAKAVSGGGLRVDQPRTTQAGDLVGSPAFMSPEQISGSHPVDGRSDVWAMGVVAYEALTGSDCFTGDTVMQVLAAVTTRTYVKPSERVPALPRAVDRWMARVLAPRPEDRYPTVGEMAAAFRASLSGKGRRRAIALAAGAAVVAGAAIGLRLLVGGEAGGAPAAGSGAPAAAQVPSSGGAPAAASPATPEITPAADASPSPSPSGHTRAPAAPATPPPSAPSSSPSAPSSAPSSEPVATTTQAVSAPPPVPTAPTRPPKKIDPSEIQ